LALACVLCLPACNGSYSSPSELLGWGDAEWPPAPIPQPGDGSAPDDGAEGDGAEGEEAEAGEGGGGDGWGDDDGGLFLPGSDIPSLGSCDPFAQDCPEGEKCVAYASSGGDFDANKCVPVLGEGLPGEFCSYTDTVHATDDCNTISYCWNVTDGEGACAQFCGGNADSPQCPADLECLIGYAGSIALCVEQADEPDQPALEQPELAALVPDEELESVCPDTTEPVVLYMSNDDSNSQASPTIVRRLIREGHVVQPSAVRIHEFLNYYTIATGNPTDKPAEVAMQMRRTNASTGEFTLLLSAKGVALHADDRPPLNLVFSVDTSGSMHGERLDLLKQSMYALAGQLRAGDVISMVEWSTVQSVILNGYAVTGPYDDSLVSAIGGLNANGGTDFHGGLMVAYDLAKASYIGDGINRVIIISDGGANAGITDLNLIANAAAAEDGNNIYLVGVGVAPAEHYQDTLMDQLTDAGKGAYVFVDSHAEAQLQFSERFLSNIAVAARDVRMRLTLPWYFGIKAFHGEEYSADPAKVEPQHLAPNDAMNYHQIIGACDRGSIRRRDTIEARVDYLHPLTLEPMSDSVTMTLDELVKADAKQLYKADVVVGYAKSIIVIGALMNAGQTAKAIETANDMKHWLILAAQKLNDPEIAEMAAVMSEYIGVLEG